MDPTFEECAKFESISDVFQWLEMEPPLCAAFTAATGAKSSLCSWARIPAERYTEVVTTIMVNDGGVERRQTPAEEGQAGDVRRIALLALQGPSASAGAGGGKGQQYTPQSAGIQGLAGQAALRTAQGRDKEVLGNSPVGQRLEEKAGWRWARQDQDLHGDGPGRRHRDSAPTPRRLEEHDRALEDQFERRRGPTEGEEATGDQLSALAFRMRSG